MWGFRPHLYGQMLVMSSKCIKRALKCGLLLLTKNFRKTILDEDWVSILILDLIAKPSSPLAPGKPFIPTTALLFEESV
jgi:hypothetical protein